MSAYSHKGGVLAVGVLLYFAAGRKVDKSTQGSLLCGKIPLQAEFEFTARALLTKMCHITLGN